MSSCASRLSHLAVLAGGPLVALALAVPPAHAQVTGGQLLSWCQGGLGSSATATFDAFQCDAYLQAYLDQQADAGVSFVSCLNTASPDAADLLAHLLPHLEGVARDDPDALQQSAHRLMAEWANAACGSVDGLPPQVVEPPEPPPEPSGPDPLAVEMAVWEATQQVQDPDRRAEAIHHYLNAYPEGRFAVIARLQLDDLANPPLQPTPDAPPSLSPGPAEPPTPLQVAEADPPVEDPDSAFWQTIKGSTDADDYREYLARFPNGLMADVAEARIASLAPPEPAPDPEVVERERLQALESGLTNRDRREVQAALQGLGLYTLGVDGIFGPGTRRAIRGYQQRIGSPQTGYLTASERTRLLAEVPPPQDTPVAATPVAAQPDGVLVVNATGSPIYHLSIRPLGSSASFRNALNGSILLPNTSLFVPISRSSGGCAYRLEAVDAAGVYYTESNLNVCSRQQVWLR
ncbi:MAG: peptidoglycan-binding protein [Rhodospirillaceae bacterium]|nr:peptidoglycan-binding protein [Rhodospirillaceae bacterium]